ncbi:MAG: hypothetical protein L6V86_05640 [Treponema sp.]|nr:MAG: hypothetical protein L6V86_05640 [Treponema sp.]
MNKLEQAGGAAYIAGLTDTVATAANINFYIDIILGCAARRDLIKTCHRFKGFCFLMIQKEASMLFGAGGKEDFFALTENTETSKKCTICSKL